MRASSQSLNVRSRSWIAPMIGLILIALSMPGIAAPPAPRVFFAHLSGAEEVPTLETAAVGEAVFRRSADGLELSYRLIVANIDNVVAAHIHLAPAGENGSVVAFLAGPFPPTGGPTNGVLATGTITAADLVGPLAGQDLSVLLEAMRTGGTYVNVHTNDGVAPPGTGPGDFPGGEIRGQIEAAGAP